MAARLCSIEGCDGPHKAHGWCDKHYKRWQKHGDTQCLVRPPDCRRIGVAVDGRPFCVHGPMRSGGKRLGGSRWVCNRGARDRYARWKAAHPGAESTYAAAWAKANPEKRRGHFVKYGKSRIRVSVGGLEFVYRVQPERREEVLLAIAEKRAQLQTEYQEAADGWKHQTVA